MTKLASGLLIGVALALAIPLAAQQPATPTFKSNVNAVMVDVRALDRDGRSVEDLKQRDFAIFEDGREQAISTFEHVTIPVETDYRPVFAAGPVDSDTVTNSGPEGRLYILLLDDYHTHTFRSVTVRAIAREFIESNMNEWDRAVVLTTSGRVQMTQEFTNNRKRLLDLVDRFEGGFDALSRCDMTAPVGQEKASDQLRILTALAPVVESGSCTIKDDRSTLDLLSRLSTWMASVNTRRKAIVFISEGFEGRQTNAFDEPESDTDAFLDDLTGGSATRSKRSDDAAAIGSDFKELVKAAAVANVSIYSIDPNGDPNAPSNGVKPVAALGDETQFDAKHLANRMMLDALSKATGGVALSRSNDFSQLLDRAVSDSSSYYLIGYVPNSTKRDNAFRKLDVRVSRPGVSVQSRAGYVPKTEPVRDTKGTKDTKDSRKGDVIPVSLTDLMATPAQVSGLTMNVSAPVFLGTGPKAAVEVVIEIAGKDLTLTGDPKGNGPLELLMAVADVDGKVKATEHGSFDLKFSAATRQTVSENGLRVLSRLDVEPGHYLLRVVGVDAGGFARGSVQYDLDVPDFSKSVLTMSGLALAASSELKRPTTGSDTRWKQRFRLAPTAARTFPAGTEIEVSGDIYAGDRSVGDVDVLTTVQTERGDVLFRHQEPLAPVAGTTPATFKHQTSLSLRGMLPGAYLLTVEARSHAGQGSASRQIPFDVK